LILCTSNSLGLKVSTHKKNILHPVLKQATIKVPGRAGFSSEAPLGKNLLPSSFRTMFKESTEAEYSTKKTEPEEVP
jgi:hypothetical protein